MGVEILTTKRLRLALLARQGLLEPVDMSLPRAIERFGGLQTQYAPSAYVGLRARVAGFARGDLTKALERRSVIQGTLMRSTIHMVSRSDYWPFAAAIREQRREWWLRVARHDATDADMHRHAATVERALADGPRKAKDLKDELGLDSATWNGVGLWLDLVRVPPSGTWERRRADLYGLATEWVGPDDGEPEAGLELLIRRYLKGFGPASVADVASFIQMPVTKTRSAIESMRLSRYESEDGTELVDVPRSPLPDLDTEPRRVAFLGTWDATLLVHCRRTQLLPEEHRSKLFHVKVPQSMPPFLVDGQVRGAWRYDKGEVTLTLFESLPKTTVRLLEAEAKKLAAFHQ